MKRGTVPAATCCWNCDWNERMRDCAAGAAVVTLPGVDDTSPASEVQRTLFGAGRSWLNGVHVPDTCDGYV